MGIDEIVLPITDPETEWVRGRALQKVSPRRDHSRIQLKFASLLDVWSRGRGEVGTEWRFRIAVAGEPRRPLVPDIAFVASERLRDLSHEELQTPDFAPTIAVEVLSPGDVAADVESKIDVYLRGGSSLVLVLDSERRSILVCDSNARRLLHAQDTLAHPLLQDFRLPIGAFFALALDPVR